MGWSCSAAAGRTLEAIQAACVASTGSQNTWEEPGRAPCFFELDSTEHDDGAITGDVFRMAPGTSRCRATTRFRIEADGRLSIGPRFFRGAVANPMTGTSLGRFILRSTR